MARVPEAELARIKREVDLSELVGRSGVALTRRGQDLVGLCPFHDDTEPSLVVSPAKNLWHCLGACQAGGSVIDWVMRFEGVSFRHAVELLRSDYAPSDEALTETPPSARGDEVRRPGFARGGGRGASRAGDRLLPPDPPGEPEALAYLEQRGLSSREAIERFRLGYANRTMGYRIPQRQWQRAATAGPAPGARGLRETGHEHFNGSLVVPVFDAAAGWWRSTGARSATTWQADADPSLPAGSAPRGLEPGGARGLEGGDPQRVAARRADLLVRGLSQRHRCLRRRGLHPGAPGGLPRPTGRSGS